MKTILVDAVDCFIIEKENGKFEILQEMFNLLEVYSNKKIILTGANKEQQKKFGFNNLPYEFFTLNHNPEKIDPEYYKILLKKYHLKTEEVIYFEHNIKAVESAQSVGIKTYFYENDKKDLIALKNFLDKNLEPSH